jgi:hypothetical protein
MNALLFGVLIILAGFVVYGATGKLRRRATGVPQEFAETETA